MATFGRGGRDQFNSYVGDSNSVNLAKWRMAGTTGALNKSQMRSVFWKVYLGALDPDNVSRWPEQLRKNREDFRVLRGKVMVDPSNADNVSVDLNNPLATAEESPWARFFEDNELCDVIRLDLERTYPDNDFFVTETAQTQMLNILFTWCKTNSDVSYRQGMNEILAPIILVVSQDCQERRGADENDVYAHAVDAEYVEHDTYWLFAKIMETMKPYFQHTKGRKSPRSPLPGQKQKEQPIILKCKYIQSKLLGEIDPDLSRYLDSQEIEPQLYGLRWVRLMFSREFHLEDVLVLWDAIFAENVGDSSSLKFIDYLACAMLLYIKEQLMVRDSVECLRRILKYPPVEDVSVLVQAAIHCRDPTKRNRIVSRRPLNSVPKKTITPVRRVDPNPQPRFRQPQQQPQPKVSPNQIRGGQAPRGKRPQRGPSAPNLRNPFSRPGGKQKTTKKQKQQAQEDATRKLSDKVDKLTKLNSSMGDQLEALISLLQREAEEARERSPDLCDTCDDEVHSLTKGPGIFVDEDVFFNALAELKQVQAVLTGLLDPSECVWQEDIVKKPLRKASLSERHELEKQLNSTDSSIFDPLSSGGELADVDPLLAAFGEVPEKTQNSALLTLDEGPDDAWTPPQRTSQTTSSRKPRSQPTQQTRTLNFPSYDGPSSSKPFLFSKHTTIPEYQPDADLFSGSSLMSSSSKTDNPLDFGNTTGKYDFLDETSSTNSEEEILNKKPHPRVVAATPQKKDTKPIVIGDDNPLAGF